MGFYLERIYSGIPSHNAIIFSFSLYVLDWWDPADKVIIQFDSLHTFDGWRFSHLPSNLCGLPTSYDGVISVYGYIHHTDPSLTMKFLSGLNQETLDESFGVRDIHLYFIQTSVNNSYICGVANGFVIFDQEVCKCSNHQYEVSPNDCVECDDACLSCFEPGPNSCYRCSGGYNFNGTDCTSCDNDCISCPSGYILYNQSCVFCPAGILFEGFCIDENRCVGLFTLDPCTNFCISPCNNEPKATWNESCFPPCLGEDIPDLELTCKGKFKLFS